MKQTNAYILSEEEVETLYDTLADCYAALDEKKHAVILARLETCSEILSEFYWEIFGEDAEEFDGTQTDVDIIGDNFGGTA